MLDFIGAARPSIADPFLPNKIEEGRYEDIRECIGCNICVSGDMTIRRSAARRIRRWARNGAAAGIPSGSRPARREAVLVVGAGPAGLEAARAWVSAVYQVPSLRLRSALGGRVRPEARLPGLRNGRGSRDWRVDPAAERWRTLLIDRENGHPGASDVLEFGAERVVLATGCHWRRDGYGRSNPAAAIPGFDAARVFTPDDLMRGRIPDGPRCCWFDDDTFYIGSVLAEVLRAAGREVIYVTADDVVASWTTYTQEYKPVQKRLRSLGMQIITAHNIRSLDNEGADLVCV